MKKNENLKQYPDRKLENHSSSIEKEVKRRKSISDDIVLNFKKFNLHLTFSVLLFYSYCDKGLKSFLANNEL